jgi:NADH-quinone oxidoreductase subunit L
MTIPLIVLAVLSVIGGFIGIPAVFAENAHSLEHFLSPIIDKTNLQPHHLEHSTEYMLMGASVALAIFAIIYAWTKYSKKPEIEEPQGAGKLLANKWYVDELYDAVIARPIQGLAGILNTVIEKSGIDAFVNGVGKSIQYAGRQIRLVQSGQVGNYILMMVLSMVLMILLIFYGNNLTPILDKIFK